MTAVPRMRTIRQCAEHLKEQDPDCGIGEWRIRQLVNKGEIPVFRAGSRILVNLDTLLLHLSGAQVEQGGQTQCTNH